MKTIDTHFLPPEIMAELKDAADRAASGIRDPEAMHQAGERMDRVREEIRQRHGTVELAVSLIREVRNEP
jgi:hypothetical protein